MRYRLYLGIFFILGLGTVLAIGEINLIDSAEAKEAEVPAYFRLFVDPDKHFEIKSSSILSFERRIIL